MRNQKCACKNVFAGAWGRGAPISLLIRFFSRCSAFLRKSPPEYFRILYAHKTGRIRIGGGDGPLTIKAFYFFIINSIHYAKQCAYLRKKASAANQKIRYLFSVLVFFQFCGSGVTDTAAARKWFFPILDN